MIEKMKRTIKTRYPVAAAISIVTICILAYYGYYRIQNYEDSVMSLYATQQDAYVQLVLDQINAQKDVADEEIISNILGSLDTSNRKYWTLTKDQALLFVKNVMETNRYKGFTTATYFVSDSAKEFLDGLTKDRVTHRMIDMKGEQYVASGVIFSYRGSEYKICLLTSQSAITDQNDFLSAQISMYIYVILLLVALLLVTMILTKVVYGEQAKSRKQQEKIRLQNEKISELGEKIRLVDAYHSRFNVYNKSLLYTFLEKLAQRKVYPVTLIQLRFLDVRKRDAFLDKGRLMLDEKVVRFQSGENDLILLMVQYQEDEARAAVNRVGHYGQEILRCLYSGNGGKQLLELADQLKEEKGEEEDE